MLKKVCPLFLFHWLLGSPVFCQPEADLPPPRLSQAQWVTHHLSTLTPDQKIGQLFWLSAPFERFTHNPSPAGTDAPGGWGYL